MSYIALYGFFSAYPIIFDAHRLAPEQIGLTFLPIVVGYILFLAFIGLYTGRYRRLNRLAEESRSMDDKAEKPVKGVEPEERLVPRKSTPKKGSQTTAHTCFSDGMGFPIVMAAAIFFPIGLFWLAWTSPPRFSVWIPMMRSVSTIANSVHNV